MECTLVKSELFVGDYIVTIRRQDGSEVRVIIPREDSASYESRCVEAGSGEIFGLNLVTEGHYT
jgi:hypothetical protein